MEILKLFPNTTQVYGWIRCVEAGTPADLDLEMYVDENVPTVFYSQAFCSKSSLAKYLADKYQADAEKWGVIDATRWNNFYKWVNDNNLVEGKIPENAGFSNEYLPK